MTETDELLARLNAWITECALDGHHWGCRAIDKLPENAGPCNCGRDALLTRVREELRHEGPTNGGGT